MIQYTHKDIIMQVACRVMLLALAVACAMPLRAQTGRSAYDFLTVPTSSHVWALGGVNIAVIDDDVTLVEQNPALLGAEIGKQLAFGYMHYMGSSNFVSARYGMAAGERGAWAAGIRYLNYGEMKGYDQNGTETGVFTPADMVVEGTYSHDFTDRLRGGINLKGVYSSYEEYTAFALSADLGLNYYNEDRDMSLSVVLKDMGGQLKRFDKAYDRLPFDLQLGWMKSFGESGFSLGVTAWHLTRWDLPYYEHTQEGLKELKLKSSFGKNLMRHLVFCGQYQPSEKFYLGLGYNYKSRSDMTTYQRNFFSGFSAGLGLKVRNFSLGVSYAQPHKSASTVLLNLGLAFGELL